MLYPRSGGKFWGSENLDGNLNKRSFNMISKKSKLQAVYGVHDGGCIVSQQECVLCHFKVDNQPKKVQDILYKWMKHFEKPKTTTLKEKKSLVRRVNKLPTKQKDFVLKFVEAMTDPDSPWVTTGQSRGLVSDVDISDEPLAVQMICWEVLSLIQAGDSADETKNGGSQDDEMNDWKMKADALPIEQKMVVKRFTNSLRWVWLKKDELSGELSDSFGRSYGDNTTAKPVSVGVH